MEFSPLSDEALDRLYIERLRPKNPRFPDFSVYKMPFLPIDQLPEAWKDGRPVLVKTYNTRYAGKLFKSERLFEAKYFMEAPDSYERAGWYGDVNSHRLTWLQDDAEADWRIFEFCPIPLE